MRTTTTWRRQTAPARASAAPGGYGGRAQVVVHRHSLLPTAPSGFLFTAIHQLAHLHQHRPNSGMCGPRWLMLGIARSRDGQIRWTAAGACLQYAVICKKTSKMPLHHLEQHKRPMLQVCPQSLCCTQPCSPAGCTELHFPGAPAQPSCLSLLFPCVPYFATLHSHSNQDCSPAGAAAARRRPKACCRPLLLPAALQSDFCLPLVCLLCGAWAEHRSSCAWLAEVPPASWVGCPQLHLCAGNGLSQQRTLSSAGGQQLAPCLRAPAAAV